MMNSKRPCILIADDDFSSRQISRFHLDKEGYDLLLACDGQEALACLERRAVDVVLLDVVMPGLNGFEVCQRMRAAEHTRRIPVILLTALDGQDYLVKGLESGADEFLSKPVNPLELSARVRSMLRIKVQMDELADNLRFRDELANMIVHDMRNPLSAIMGYSQMLMSRSDAMDAAQASEYLQIIEQQALRLHSFSNELLMVSKLENGKLLLNRDTVSLERMLEQSVTAHEPLARAKRLALELEPSAGTPLELELDPHLFLRVVENLISNAIKFTPAGGRVRLRAEYPGGAGTRARLLVIDEGMGISEEARHRIFDKYEIVTLKQSGVHQVGLGLYYCRLVVEAHGGRILVEPNAPCGSVFMVEI